MTLTTVISLIHPLSSVGPLYNARLPVQQITVLTSSNFDVVTTNGRWNFSLERDVSPSALRDVIEKLNRADEATITIAHQGNPARGDIYVDGESLLEWCDSHGYVWSNDSGN